MSIASVTTLFAVTCGFLAHFGECGCPSDSLFAKGLSFKLKTVSGYYLGFNNDPSSMDVQFHKSLSTDQYGFDWAFEKCTTGSQNNFNIKATKDGSYLYLKCGGFTCQVHDLNQGDLCQDYDWQSWRVQGLGSHCGLEHTADGDNSYICANGEGGPTLCSGMTLNTQMDFEPSNCDHMTTPIGKWVGLSFASVPSDYSIQVGVTHSYTDANTATWGISATDKMSAGFDVDGETGSEEVSVTVSESFSHTYTTELQMTKTETHTYHLGPGQFWHFQFTFQDRCGESTAGAFDYALTNSRDEKPCCLPGYFQNASIPHGNCLPSDDGKTYNLCSSVVSMLSAEKGVKSVLNVAVDNMHQVGETIADTFEESMTLLV